MTSARTCRWDHTFPWQYHNTAFDTFGHMICPSCGTELERAWSMRTIYTKPTYKHDS